jgi:hypothetical protein
MEYARSVKSVPKIIGLSKAYFEERVMNAEKIVQRIQEILDQMDDANASLKSLLEEESNDV